MSKTVKTPKGTELPLISLKGKDYLQVGHRLVWFNETETNFSIDTEFLLITDEQTVARARVTVYDKDGKALKTASATKRETKKDFSDHTEKAETSAIGRALSLLGYGTQFAIADLDEGSRLADSPMETKKTVSSVLQQASTSNEVETTNVQVTKSKPSFKKPSMNKASENVQASISDGWE